MMTKYLEMSDGPNHKIMLMDHVTQIASALRSTAWPS